MNTNKKLNIFMKAELRWGRAAQKVAAIEELGELIVEIAKSFNGKRPEGFTELIDELADTRIMIEQIEFMHALDECVKTRIKQKLERLDKILGTEGDCIKFARERDYPLSEGSDE